MIAEVKVVTVRESGRNYAADSAAKVVRFWRCEIENTEWYDSEKELAVVVLLDTKLNVKSYNLVSMGSLNASIVEPREVFRPAIAGGARCVVFLHNHPSGDPGPSAQDKELASRLAEAGKVLGVLLEDFIIVGDKQWTSQQADWTIQQERKRRA